MSQLVVLNQKKWEDIENAPIPASTVFLANSWLAYNGSGSVIPAVATNPLVGVGLVAVSTTDPDYASTTKVISYQKAGSVGLYRFLMPTSLTVTAGAFVVGQTYTILTIGSTDFTLIGASANTIGVTFVATGVGAGSGTATNTASAVAADIGKKYNLLNATTLDLTATGVQLTITNVISPQYVEVTVALPA